MATERTSLAGLVVAVVGFTLMLAGGVAAKVSHCRRDCKPDIISCLAGVPSNQSCAGTKAEKRACRKMHAAERRTCRSMVKLCKGENPGMSGICLVSSTTTTLSTPTSTTTLGSGCFTDPGDGTIHDTCTGLQWEKKDGVVLGTSNAADLHDVNNAYSWAGCCGGDCTTVANYCQPNAAAAATCMAQASGGTQGCSVCASGTCNVDPLSEGALTTVWDWLNGVNAANFAGHSDWRLPSESACNTCYSNTAFSCSACSAHELETILLSAYPCGTSPCIASLFGPTGSSHYWSATLAPGPKFAWFVAFGVGDVVSNDLAARGYVRVVRSSP